MEQKKDMEELVAQRQAVLQKIIDQLLEIEDTTELLGNENFSLIVGMTKPGSDAEHYTHSLCFNGEGAVLADNLVKTARKFLDVVKLSEPRVAMAILMDLLEWKKEEEARDAGTVH